MTWAARCFERLTFEALSTQRPLNFSARQGENIFRNLGSAAHCPKRTLPLNALELKVSLFCLPVVFSPPLGSSMLVWGWCDAYLQLAYWVVGIGNITPVYTLVNAVIPLFPTNAQCRFKVLPKSRLQCWKPANGQTTVNENNGP